MSEKWKSRYVPITHEYVVEDEVGEVIARIAARPGTERDKMAARLIAAAPELYAALWLLLGEDETGQTDDLAAEEKRNIARDVLRRAADPDNAGRDRADA
jgi:hypothetical protein